MTKPSEFRNLYFARENLPYDIVGPSVTGDSLDGGVFCMGQLIWMQDEKAASLRRNSVAVYVDGLGLVRVNSRHLLRLVSLER